MLLAVIITGLAMALIIICIALLLKESVDRDDKDGL